MTVSIPNQIKVVRGFAVKTRDKQSKRQYSDLQGMAGRLYFSSAV